MAQRFCVQHGWSHSQLELRSSMTLLVFCLGLWFVGTVAGCDYLFSIDSGELGGECMLDSDCPDPLICVYQFCHVSCERTKDCDVNAGEQCLVGHEDSKAPYSYCGIPISCNRDVECGDFRVCADGKCRDTCRDVNDCLENDTCHHGTCRNDTDPPASGWNVPATIGDHCSQDEDCASKRCDELCVGCTENYQCGSGRTCDTTALEGAGMCTSNVANLDDGPVSPIIDSWLIGDDGGFNVIDAIPDANGDFIYFIGNDRSTSNNGIFRISRLDSSLCTIFQDPAFKATTIVISGDDNTLFVNQTWPYDPAKMGGISTIDLSYSVKCETQNPQGRPWSDGLAVRAMDIHAEGTGFVFTLIAQNTQNPGEPSGLWTGTRDALGPLLATVGNDYVVDLAFGMSPKFVLSKLRQLGEFDAEWGVTEVVPDMGIGASSLALGIGEDIVYVATGTMHWSQVVAIKLSDLSARQADPLEHPFSPFVPNCDPGPCIPENIPKLKFRTSSRVNRAMRKDVFSWVTGNGELHVFTPK